MLQSPWTSALLLQYCDAAGGRLLFKESPGPAGTQIWNICGGGGRGEFACPRLSCTSCVMLQGNLMYIMGRKLKVTHKCHYPESSSSAAYLLICCSLLCDLAQCMKRYPCRQCERSFNSSTSLRRHVRNDHDTKKDYTCCYCTDKQMFAKPSLLANHIILMHGIKNPDVTQGPKKAALPPQMPAKRSKQDKTTRPKRTVEEALGQTAAPQGPDAKKLKAMYKCAKCSFTADCSADFLRHIPQHKTDNSTCQCVHCGLCYTSQISLNRHLFIVHKVKDDGPDPTRQTETDKQPDKQPKNIKQEQGGSWECGQGSATDSKQLKNVKREQGGSWECGQGSATPESAITQAAPTSGLAGRPPHTAKSRSSPEREAGTDIRI
ncbi:hypothetical protein FKM82_030576 [Ascaphus truei]